MVLSFGFSFWPQNYESFGLVQVVIWEDMGS